MAKTKTWRDALAGTPRAPLVAAIAAAAIVPLAVVLATDTSTSGNAVVAQPAQGTMAATQREVTHLWETVKVRTGDTFARILSSRGHDSQTVHQIIHSGPAAGSLASLKAGTTINMATDPTGEVSEISYAPDPYSVVNIRRNAEGGYDSEVIKKEPVKVTRFAEGTVEDSLFGAGKRAGISDTVILEMADAFGYDIDFALDVQQGDSFRVVYEEDLVDGKKVADGDVLAAEFTNQGKTYRAIRFTTSNGRTGYYTPDGLAMRKAFLRTPVDFARISSGFSLKRFHPVMHTFRAHKGIDYAASRGTPVKATADGRIQYAGNQGGYGRVIIIQHAGNQSTLYGHLDHFASTVRAGSRVSQGQVIGYVGATGLASGPHLHYEFRVNGVHVNPLSVKTTQAEPIAQADRAAFMAQANRMVAMMDSFSGKTAVAQSTPAKGARSDAKL